MATVAYVHSILQKLLPGCQVEASRYRNKRIKVLLRALFIENAFIIAAQNWIFSNLRQTDIYSCLTGFKKSSPQRENAGGGRGRYLGTLIRKVTIIGPPHFGHFHRPEAFVDCSSFVSASGDDPRHWKQSGKSLLRRRLARNPKFRIRTKPFGSR